MAKVNKFEILSAIGTVIFGSMLHFVFAWLGSAKIVALIAAVNESTWEHLKLAFWPALIFSAIFYFVIKTKPHNFFLAQAAKFFSMPVLIIILFYGWKLFFADSLIYDISIFVVAVIAGHIFSYYIEKSEKNFKLEKLAIALIAIGILKFSFFTYFPPQMTIFLDPVTGGYGIIK